MIRTLSTIALVCASLVLGSLLPAAADVPEARPLVLAQLDSSLTGTVIPAQFAGGAETFQVAQSGCLSQAQIRQAVASGQARPLSAFIAGIRQVTGSAQVLPGPQLCWSGGGLVYIVNVLSGSGSVRTVTISAANGTILSY